MTFQFFPGSCGIGIQGQTNVHWAISLVTFANILFFLHFLARQLAPDISIISRFLSFCWAIFTLLYLLIKRNSIRKFYSFALRKLSEREKKVVSLVEKLAFGYVITVFAREHFLQFELMESCGFYNYLWFLEPGLIRCILNNFLSWQLIVCTNWIFVTCAFYSVSHLIFYFTKANMLSSLEQLTFDCSNYNGIFLLALQIEELHELFDSTFSPVLFWNILCNSIHVSRMLYSSLQAAKLEALNFKLFFISDLTDVFSLLIITFATIIVISWLQYKLEKRTEAILHSVSYLGVKDEYSNRYTIIGERIRKACTLPVTVWAMVPVKSSLLLSLVSSYIVFPVLLVQINNGALQK